MWQLVQSTVILVMCYIQWLSTLWFILITAKYVKVFVILMCTLKVSDIKFHAYYPTYKSSITTYKFYSPPLFMVTCASMKVMSHEPRKHDVSLLLS